MRLLLDTHIVLWGFTGEARLTAAEEAAIRAPDNEIMVSVVSFWEIAIKVAAGKLNAPHDLPKQVERTPDISVLPVLASHAWRVRTLTRLHGDPFDHLLLAQADIEGLTLMTRDRWMSKYGVAIFSG